MTAGRPHYLSTMQHFLGASLFGKVPAPIVVEVETCLLSRPGTFFRREPTEVFVNRLVHQCEHMSPAMLICNTLELARTHPLLLLRVREAEERKAILARKREVSNATYKLKKARHGKDPDTDDDGREPDEPADVLRPAAPAC